VSGQQAPHDSTPPESGPVAGLQDGTPVTEEVGRILSVLSTGDIELKGRIPWSSNATFLVSVRAAPASKGAAGTGEDLLAIYKPTSGERPLWDFPRGLWKREVAAYELCSFMGWDIVPPTTARPDGPLGVGSLQFCIDASPDEHFFTLVDDPQQHRALRRIAAFDLVANNADRKSGHCLLDQDGHIWAIDHGLCFHTSPKLRTVIWDFAGEKLDQDLLAPFELLAGAEVPAALESLLSEAEIAAISARAKAALAHRRYPKPRGDFPYPWPLI
jgi:uncharacterized repeat protein (TIGR03843 family)